MSFGWDSSGNIVVINFKNKVLSTRIGAGQMGSYANGVGRI